MRLGIVGDLHGNSKWASKVLNFMGERKITHVFVVGDFGLWTHEAGGHEFLDELQSSAEENNLSVFAVPGNHENHDHWEWYCANMPTHKGFAIVRRRVLLSPKVHEFRLANKQFVVAGGAVSIDKDYRLARERGGNFMDRSTGWDQNFGRGKGARTLYWPNEELTDQDVMRVKTRMPKADILLTHDCSNFTQFNGRLKPDVDSERHRRRIDEVIKAVEPKMHFHGHMHTKYVWDNTLSHGDSAFIDDWNGPVTKTYGLEADPVAMYNNSELWSWGILDTDTMEFAYRGEGMQFRSLEE